MNGLESSLSQSVSGHSSTSSLRSNASSQESYGSSGEHDEAVHLTVNSSDQSAQIMLEQRLAQSVHDLINAPYEQKLFRRGILHNLVNDFLVAYSGKRDIGDRLQSVSGSGPTHWDSELFGQMEYGGIGFASVTVLTEMLYALTQWYFSSKNSRENSDDLPKDKGVGTTDIFTMMVGVLAAIYASDRGQSWGLYFGNALGFSTQGSGYFASMFLAMAAAPVPPLVNYLLPLVWDAQKRNELYKDPKAYFKKLGLEASLGLVPLAAWQMFYTFASVTLGLSAGLTSLCVALPVCGLNIAASRAGESILQSSCCQQNDEDAVTENNDCDCFSCLPTCGLFHASPRRQPELAEELQEEMSPIIVDVKSQASLDMQPSVAGAYQSPQVMH